MIDFFKTIPRYDVKGQYERLKLILIGNFDVLRGNTGRVSSRNDGIKKTKTDNMESHSRTKLKTTAHDCHKIDHPGAAVAVLNR